jgi:hypothetical protein
MTIFYLYIGINLFDGQINLPFGTSIGLTNIELDTDSLFLVGTGWYQLVFSWYLPYLYQRKTRMVYFGIGTLTGTPFSLKRGVLAPFLMHPSQE